jgi:hypothetical protein
MKEAKNHNTLASIVEQHAQAYQVYARALVQKAHTRNIIPLCKSEIEKVAVPPFLFLKS